ncbi:hypothetical protein SAMD00019534_063520 [Acytostelium subglobosum LB1]|uniref:hypothetical protein n=1 Tax=Acytostelium subglobosum LB1 TaxID=1410327 RepID=UPI0006451AB5|nr:hypothetical protein SAMD00019534_063520 [Acytostelium subglobosum LB1]GAM23177.1 hypothetical protein SAMD00019534_063520 [Acytostelium subglobosum LB1]|eukprot:XP_012753626.1 hypothetical protein SAMD00019534_063520 [Acytostelium subglobosum LB1]
MTISGDNFGWFMGDYTKDTNTYLKLLVPNSLLLFTLPVSAYQGSPQNYTDYWKTFLFLSQNNNMLLRAFYKVDNTSISKTISSFGSYNDNSTLTLSFSGVFQPYFAYKINVNGVVCNIIEISPVSIGCTVSNMTRYPTENLYAYISSVIQNYTRILVDLNNYPLINAVSNVTTSGGAITLYGYYGPNINSVGVTINGRACSIFNDTYLPSLISCSIKGQLSPGMANITVRVNEKIYSSTSILEIQSVKNVDCGSNDGCNGNGVCQMGRCACTNPGYTGFYCESPVGNDTIVLPINQDPGAYLNGSQSEFQFNMVAIQELNARGGVEYELRPQWAYSAQKGSPMSTYTYTMVNQSNETSVNITVILTHSTEEYTVNFAGHDTLYPPNSIKMTVYINGWQYSSNLNTLRVLFVKQHTLQTSACSGSNVGYDEFSGNMEYIKISGATGSYYGRFLPYGLSDGRICFSKNELVNTTDDNRAFFGINLPQCRSCVIDPYFTSLTEVSGDHCSRNKAAWYIILPSVVGGVLVLTLAAGVTVLILKKFRQKKESKNISDKMQRVFGQASA